MGIFFIVVGAILLIICGIYFYSASTILKNEDTWEIFYKTYQESCAEPEEVIYNTMCKIRCFFGIGTIISLVLVTFGIILLII